MGGKSNAFGKDYTLDWFKQHKQYINRIIDIGPGKGTYYNLLHKDLPNAKFTGVEAWGPYVQEYKLEERYEKVVIGDARYIDYSKLGKFDVAIAGDILEHMSKEDAIQVAWDMLDIAPTLIISIPVIHLPQGALAGNPFEVHVKDDWTHEEMLETFGDLVYDYYHEEGKVVAVYFLRKP